MQSIARAGAVGSLIIVTAIHSIAAQSTTSVAREVFHKAFFASYQTASIGGVPMSYASGDPGRTSVRSSGTGSALGVGISGLFGDDRWLLQLGYDRASTRLSDWRVRDRVVAFNSVDMTVGYALRGAVSVVPYFTFAPGWYTQSDFKEFEFVAGATGPDDSQFEAMDSYDYFIAVALGAKVAFARRFALTAESRWYSEDTGGGGSCGPNCVVIETGPRKPPERYGSRTSVGLQVYFGW